MKLIHLSDLHLGKRVNEFSMLEDQAFILKQILEIADREKPDGVLLAGDLYDKPVPPAEAVGLLDWFLTELSARKIAVFAISGNHDSAERIAFGSRLMGDRGVFLSPVYDGTVEKVEMQDEYGTVCVYLLPFLKPAVVRGVWKHKSDRESGAEHGEDAEHGENTEHGEDTAVDQIRTYDDALRRAVSSIQLDLSKRNLLVSHQFVTGASRCESEEIFVGGLDQIDASIFDDFDYVALGHIHSPQHVGRETVRYCGTPLKYSFSEAGQEKSVTVVELKEKGDVSISTIPLRPLRDLRKIKGTYLEVTSRDFYAQTNTSDYLQITLTDEEDILDGLQKLRIIYPNLMQLEYDNQRTRENQEILQVQAMEEKSELELFEEFYQLQNNQPMSEEQKEFTSRLIQKLKEEGQ